VQNAKLQSQNTQLQVAMEAASEAQAADRAAIEAAMESDMTAQAAGTAELKAMMTKLLDHAVKTDPSDGSAERISAEKYQYGESA
jgi:hypothetical protein